MILTICFDPILESIYSVDNLLPYMDNPSSGKIYNIDGQGISSGKILKKLNIDVFATGFLGGLTGQYIFSRLKDMDIYNEFVFIKDETKSKVSIFQGDRLLTSITEQSPRITREELGSFYSIYKRLLNISDIICSQGSLPLGLDEGIYYDLIALPKENNKKFILDARDKVLKPALEAKPFLIKLGREELENLSNLKLHYETEIIKIGYSIIERGVTILIIDLDERGSIVLTKDKGYRLEIDSLNTDNLKKDNGYMVSGFSYGIYKNYDLDTTMRLAQGMRIAYAKETELERIDMSDIKRIMSQIDIRQINY